MGLLQLIHYAVQRKESPTYPTILKCVLGLHNVRETDGPLTMSQDSYTIIIDRSCNHCNWIGERYETHRRC